MEFLSLLVFCWLFFGGVFLLDWLFEKSLMAEKARNTPAPSPAKVEVRGFMDLKTGRRVDIDPKTRKEIFVD